MAENNILISAQELREIQNEPTTKIVDASWHLPGANRNAWAEYEKGHIEGAVFVDIDDVSDRNSKLPHTLPPADYFAKKMGELGISATDQIIVYDSAGMFSAARVWWMFKNFGAQNCRLLNGGLPAWKMANYPVTDKSTNPAAANFDASWKKDAAIFFEEMKDIVAAQKTQILDARGPGRFNGTEAEPRPGMRAGHMPGAINVHYATLLNPDGTFKSAEELRTIFAQKDVNLHAPIATTCGSGVTAAIILVALALIGKTDTRLYDGSWSEWGSKSDTPVETS